MWSNPDQMLNCYLCPMCYPLIKLIWQFTLRITLRFIVEINYKSLSHNAEYKNKFTDDFFLLLAWMSVFSSGQPHCKTCHSSDGNENNFRSAVQANSQSQYLHWIEVSRIFPSNFRKTNRFFTKDIIHCAQILPQEKLKNYGLVREINPSLFLYICRLKINSFFNSKNSNFFSFKVNISLVSHILALFPDVFVIELDLDFYNIRW